jgi:hypothetical protein
MGIQCAEPPLIAAKKPTVLPADWPFPRYRGPFRSPLLTGSGSYAMPRGSGSLRDNYGTPFALAGSLDISAAMCRVLGMFHDLCDPKVETVVLNDLEQRGSRRTRRIGTVNSRGLAI